MPTLPTRRHNRITAGACTFRAVHAGDSSEHERHAREDCYREEDASVPSRGVGSRGEQYEPDSGYRGEESDKRPVEAQAIGEEGSTNYADRGEDVGWGEEALRLDNREAD